MPGMTIDEAEQICFDKGDWHSIVDARLGEAIDLIRADRNRLKEELESCEATLDKARADLERLRVLLDTDPADVDFLLERYEQTEPALQRQILVRFIRDRATFAADNERLRGLLKRWLEAINPEDYSKESEVVAAAREELRL